MRPLWATFWGNFLGNFFSLKFFGKNQNLFVLVPSPFVRAQLEFSLNVVTVAVARVDADDDDDVGDDVVDEEQPNRLREVIFL